MKIEDLTGLSKPLTKLVEVISQGVGAISKPYLIKKTADAKAYEIKKIAEAIKDQQKNLKSIDYSDTKLSLESLDEGEMKSIQERSQNRTEYQEFRKQQNIESITGKTVGYIENEREVSEDPVNEDWTTRFFNHAQDISDEEMQELWARILAGEVIKPGSFSLRTLELIRNLSPIEAKTFTRLANLHVISYKKPFIFNKSQPDGDFLAKYGCDFEDRLLLTEVGLLQPDTGISRNLPENKNENPILIYYESSNILLRQTIKSGANKTRLPIFRFSKIGEELLKIVTTEPNMKYLKDLAAELSKENSECHYVHITKKMDDGGYNHTMPWIKI